MVVRAGWCPGGGTVRQGVFLFFFHIPSIHAMTGTYFSGARYLMVKYMAPSQQLSESVLVRHNFVHVVTIFAPEVG